MSRFQHFFRLSNIRRIVQLLVFLLFLILLVQTVYPLKSWLPADFFLRLDPLTAIGTILSSRSAETLLTKFLPAVIIVFLTLFLGRFFCNWICPLGTTIDFADRAIRGKSKWVRPALDPERSEGEGKPKLVHTPQLRNLKYYILGGFLVAALLSLQIAWLMDAIPIVTRSYAVTIYSYFSYAANALLGPLWQVPIVNKVSEPIYGFLRDNVFLPNSELGYQSITMLHHVAFIAFMGILALSLLYPRFWCRDLCPLGALFGLLSKVSFLRWVVDKEKCVECNRCYHECKTNAILEKGDGYLVQECVDCFNCQDVCPTDAIKFAFQSPSTSLQREKQYTPQGLDLSKRRFIQAAALGAVAVPFLKLKPSDRAYPPFLIRPPGSLPEEEFLDKCIRCAECMKVCPTNVLHPTLFEAGVEGIGTPKLVPKMGYCDYECNACGQVCPTSAIEKLTLAEKKKLKIGTAYFNKNKCYPWNENINCLVCEEHCPTPEKSIKFWEVEVLEVVHEVNPPYPPLEKGETERSEQKTNKTVIVKRPYVVTETCIGCGICENKCPIKEEPGVRVTARGEARHRERYSGGRGVDE